MQRHRLAPHLAVAARHVGEQRAYARLLELGCSKTIAEQLRAIPVTKELMGDLTAARKAWCEQGGKENISFCKPTAAAPA